MNHTRSPKIARSLANVRRRGSAAVLLSLILLLLTTATAVITLQAQANSRRHFETAQDRQILHAAMDAVSAFPVETLMTGIRLPHTDSTHHEINIVLDVGDSNISVLIATELRNGQPIQSVEREFEITIP